ncbi:MAG: hypothetical protein U5J96_14565 [Ignavibacteriaceae bacterium]|nr:hypothetical protein [Ignavibacteriaceae bacterium]
MKDKIIYQLTIEAIQNVAEENFGRKLTSKEIKKILDPIADSIPWYDAICDAIRDKLEIEELDPFDKDI